MWTHKVVKRAKGSDGRLFDYPTAGTFASEADARSYAVQFAIEQGAAGVAGAEYTVRRRGGRCSTGVGEIVATYAPGGASQ